MSAVSPEVAHAMSIALALCLNIVLAASVYSDVESEHTSQVLIVVSAAANPKRPLRLLICFNFLNCSQKRQNFYDEAGIPRVCDFGMV